MGTCRGIDVSTHQGEQDWAAQENGAYDALVAANFDPAVATTLTGHTAPPQTEVAS